MTTGTVGLTITTGCHCCATLTSPSLAVFLPSREKGDSKETDMGSLIRCSSLFFQHEEHLVIGILCCAKHVQFYSIFSFFSPARFCFLMSITWGWFVFSFCDYVMYVSCRRETLKSQIKIKNIAVFLVLNEHKYKQLCLLVDHFTWGEWIMKWNIS